MAKNFLDGYETYDSAGGFGNAKKWKQAFRQRMTNEEAVDIIAAQKETPYSLLGVSLNATKSEIKAAFRRLINEWHPDKNQHRLPAAEEMSKKLIAAYMILSAKH